jgi:hypothetical protein
MSLASYSLQHLSDTALLDSLARVVKDDRRLCAELLAHLAEVDTRRLYLAYGHASLFKHCVERLGFSEDEAAKRIWAARTARRHPVIFERIANGELTLTAVNLIAPHLSADNENELLALAAHKSKRELEELLAARSPKPDVAACLRKLPAAAPPHIPAVTSAPSAPAISPHAPRPELAGESATQHLAPSPAPRPAAKRAVLEPLSAQRFSLRLTLSRQGRDALLRARALLPNRDAHDDLNAVVERAVLELCQRLESKKFGKRQDRRTKPTALESEPDGPTASPEHAPENAPPTPGARAVGSAAPAGPEQARVVTAAHKPRSRYIPRSARRAVAARDQYRCAYVSADGHRCTETARLEFHHRQPYARGGESTVAGLELRCRMHNDMQARLDFGEAHVAAMKQARTGRFSGSPPSS